MKEQTRDPIEVIAEQMDFADHGRMRRAFLRTLGQLPSQVTRRNTRMPMQTGRPGP